MKKSSNEHFKDKKIWFRCANINNNFPNLKFKKKTYCDYKDYFVDKQFLDRFYLKFELKVFQNKGQCNNPGSTFRMQSLFKLLFIEFYIWRANVFKLSIVFDTFGWHASNEAYMNTPTKKHIWIF